MKSRSRVRAVSALLVVLVVFVGGCAGLPKLDGRVASTALTGTGDTRLGAAVRAAAAAHPGKSGIYPLEIPTDAFAARVVLMRAAERSLDVQYCIWHGDTTGYLLLGEVWDAAERGVRVRVLLDDNGIAGLDAAVAALDSHPNIEVRLFNPFVNRRFKALGFLTDFDRVNRRMHNKSLTADTQATVVGGRNVGDEYFGAGGGMVFADLDVLAVGPAASDVAGEFDLYWNSESAYPAELIVGAARPDAVPALKAKVESVRESPEAREYVEAVKATRLIEALIAQNLPIEWVPVRLVYDEPTKALGKADDAELLFTRLHQAVGKAQREIELISPYFVPGKAGTAALSALPQQGVRLRIVTNSLAATDVGAVHAGYAKRRKPLLRGGAKIYELKPDARTPQAEASGRAAGGGFGSSSASLHAKTFAVDRSRVFVGSFNFDPRSLRLNTEMGLVIESAKLADAVSTGLDRAVERSGYEVVLGKNGGLEWVERTEQGEVRYSREPKTGFFRRLWVGFMSLLPIEGMP
jgi:putative cardiolipin synthase